MTINVAVLLAVIVGWRLRRPTPSRSRFDEKLTAVIVRALGVPIAPTPAGEGILNISGAAREQRHPGRPMSTRIPKAPTAPIGIPCGSQGPGE